MDLGNTAMLTARRKLEGQTGYILLSVMLFVTLLLFALAVAAPRIGQQIKREREEELIHRGQEYATAIKKFYRANNGQYPVSLDQLENTNNKRYLRKRYKDPITGKDDWKLIHVGEAILNLTPPTIKPGSDDSSGSGSGNGLSSGGNDQKNTGQTSPPSGLGPPQGQIGGGQIIGVASISKEKSIKELKGKDHYNEWQFIYDPRFDKPGGPGTIINPSGGPTGGPAPGPPPDGGGGRK
jgi:type II secretory pathway pseudopilin PulG